MKTITLALVLTFPTLFEKGWKDGYYKAYRSQRYAEVLDSIPNPPMVFDKSLDDNYSEGYKIGYKYYYTICKENK